jgi:site-specific recombinase XerD
MPKSLPAEEPPDLAALLASWEIILRSENKSPATITTYMRGVKLFLRWCERSGHPAELTRDTVQAYTAKAIAGGAEATTVRIRQASLRQFSKWLAEEGELPDDPLAGLKPPKVPAKVVKALTDDQLRALIRACRGKSLRDRRDEAIVRLLVETGLRANECVGLEVGDVDLKRGLATVRKGKGAKARTAPFGPQTAAALDRYIRMRRSHRFAETPALWLGVGGKTFGYHGLNDTLRDRAKTAGIEGFHLHLTRHTAATRWLRAGGSEGGLMSIAGWKTRDMIDRYTGASASERAAAEARGLNLGEL